MAIKLSNRIQLIKPSPTLAMSTKAKVMTDSGMDVVNFGVGEPDFNTPDYIKQAAHKAIDDNFTRYTANAGIIELRQGNRFVGQQNGNPVKNRVKQRPIAPNQSPVNRLVDRLS